ncbi:MAG: competence protein, partial [Propionibacterium sp.]
LGTVRARQLRLEGGRDAIRQATIEESLGYLLKALTWPQ